MATGKIIGDKAQYRLDSPVAVGAFSTVYRCTELSTGRAYAIKIIDKKVAADNHMKEALIREVNALEIAGSSPYVTKLVDKMVSKHNYYLVMELAEGGTLLDLIREQRQELRVLQASISSCRDMSESLRSGVPAVMQYDRVQHFFKQLLLALASLHDHDVVHRDVKPENILLNKRRTRLVLSDFGFACHAPPGTELHRACGTLRYCAPELLHENPRYDGRKVDVWAAGVTLYVMLFGGHPFRCPSQDPDSLLETITTTRLRIPRPIPTDIEDILRRMLCVNPAERWSVQQLLQHPWMAALGTELRTPSVRSASSTRTFASPVSTSAMSAGPSRTFAHETAEAVVELLSEDCPPIDAIPSDEEVVDDGFYQSSTDDKNSSSGSSNSPTQSGTSTQLPTAPVQLDASPVKTEASSSIDAAITSLPVPILSSDENVRKSAEVAPPAAPATPATPAKREVLQQGSVYTSMVSIESAGDSDDERSTTELADDAAFLDDVANDVYPSQLHRDAARRASSAASSSVSTNNTYRDDDGQLSFWWVRYSYGLFLTARIVARFIGFFSLCVVAVAVRVVLRRDLVDLPLPEVLRNYVAFLLSTPLRRSHIDHRAPQSPPPSLAATMPSAAFPPSSMSASRSLHDSTNPAPRAAGPHPAARYNGMLPIPGSGLRHYVRTADQLMRDSFVGNAVLEHNASLTDPQAALASAPVEGGRSELASMASITSSPAAPSLATIAPCRPSVTESLVSAAAPDTPTTANATASTPLEQGSARDVTHSVDSRAEAEGDWIVSECRTANEDGQGRRDSRCNSAAQLAAEKTQAADDATDVPSSALSPPPSHPASTKSTSAAIVSTHESPLFTLVSTASSPNPEVVVSNATRRGSATAAGAAAAAPSGQDNKRNPDSQTGATDTTESGDSGEDKAMEGGAGLQYMLSPIAPLPRAFPGHRQRSEDFPIMNEEAAA